ncbi:MAG TPA: DHA2 family efflux MFS transporter permease subunit [Acidisphaera sp.]|nr:DHA2 family efflux MFS transporter permease subunit [Acidisphaera sp.]
MSGRTTSNADAGPQQDKNWKPRANPWLIAVCVTLAAFMEILDTTIVNVSLPHIAGSVSVSYDDATWCLTSYLVANGIVLTISGWLGRLLGRKRYFMICIAGFTVFSFLCGTSQSLGELVFFRLMQGFFGGGLQPNQQSIVLDTFEPARRGQAFSVVAIAVIFAPVIGPTLGGYITDTYSWRWIFFINIPVGLLAFFGVQALVEDPPWVLREARNRKRFDAIGLALIVLGLGCLQVMLDRGEDLDWFSSPEIQLFAIGAAVGIIGAVIWLLWTENPIVNLQVYRDRNFALGSIMIFGFGGILYSSAIVVPQLAQVQLGYTALLAGLVLSPGALMILFLIPIVGRVLLPNVQTRFIIAFGFFSLGCALLWARSVIEADIDFWTLVLIRATQTFGLAFLFVPNSTITYSTLPKELNSDGSALFVMFRNVSGSIGIALATAMLTERAQVHRGLLVDNLSVSDRNYQLLVQQYQSALHNMGVAAGQIANEAQGLVNQTLNSQAAMLGYMDVFMYSAVVAFCVVPIAFLFKGTKAGGGVAPAH